MQSRIDEIRIVVKQLYDECRAEVNQKEFKKAHAISLKAIENLNSIPVANFVYDDWRNLAGLQNVIGIANQDPQQAWHEKAITSLQQIPEKYFTSDDWHDLATFQCNSAIESINSQQKVAWYEKAGLSLMHIRDEDLEADDLRTIAYIQYRLAVGCTDPQQKFVLLENATRNLMQIFHNDSNMFTLHDWRYLAHYQSHAGINAGINNPQKIVWHEKSIVSLQQIKKHFTMIDWHNLAKYQFNIGRACYLPQEKYAWYEKAIKSIAHIPQENYTAQHWHDLAIIQIYVGIVCRDKKEWKKAENYFYCSLEAYIHVDNKKPGDYQNIAQIYLDLQSFSLQSSPEYQLFNYAYNIFIGTAGLDFEQFLRFHRHILNSFNTQPNAFHRGLLFLMRLIDTSFNQVDFPNQPLANWLSNQTQHQQFRQMLQDIEQAYNPLSLLSNVDQSAGFSVALVRELSNLQKEVQVLKEENKQLKVSSPGQNSIYKSNLTTFNAHVNRNQQSKPEINNTNNYTHVAAKNGP
jgi:hypothetical protein